MLNERALSQLATVTSKSGSLGAGTMLGDEPLT
jgi:hypothetical protein